MPAWLILAPANEAVLVWQLSQAAVVTICVAALPVAEVPLWQDAQFPVTPSWFHLTPVNRTVLLWQVSQAAVVAMCVSALPRACDPLWQPTQEPRAWL